MTGYSHGIHTIAVLTTGVGMVATAAWCSRVLTEESYDVAFNAGVCGSFDPSLVPGTVVHVVADRMAELGAEDADRFLTIHEMKLLGDDEFPLQRGLLVNTDPPVYPALAGLPAVTGITVNTVHGHEPSIAAAVARFAPQVESMEGAAFMYACLIHGVPFAQVRAVSNIVERRNRAAWKLHEAIDRLSETMTQLVDEL